jgi:hypothetical protein
VKNWCNSKLINLFKRKFCFKIEIANKLHEIFRMSKRQRGSELTEAASTGKLQ